MRRFVALLGWSIMAWLAALVAWETVLLVGTPLSEIGQPFRDSYRANLPVVAVHGASALVALVAGVVQLLPPVRRLWPCFHRRAGWTYVAAIGVAVETAFQMSLRAFGGEGPRVFLCAISLLWAWTTLRALRAARARRFDEHARWMARSFALTFGAVTLRYYLSALAAHGHPLPEVYTMAVWAAWLPNLLACEALLASRRWRKIE